VPSRRILVADPDSSSAELLGSSLRRRGYRVVTAPDAPRALELAVLRPPDLILLNPRSQLLDARTFVRILRANPRTEGIPVLLVDEASLGGGAGSSLALDPALVLSRVERIFRRAEETRGANEATLGGDLGELPLVDLLQVLALNRRSGRLRLGRDGQRGEVCLYEGRIADAAVGAARGEKALGRLLAVRDGPFAFLPGPPGPEVRMNRRVEDFVLDGLRQLDEMALLAAELPGPDERLTLAVPPAAVPDGIHPVAGEVVALLARPTTLRDLVDRGTATDLEIMRALAVLVRGGFVRRGPPSRDLSERGPPLSAAARDALRSRLTLPDRVLATGKVLLCGGGPLTRRASLSRFGSLPGFVVLAPGGQVEQGTLGTLEWVDGVRLDLVALPSDPALRPLWRVLAAGALGALLLVPADGLEAPLVALGSALRLPIFACGPRAAAEAAAKSLRIDSLGSDPAEALASLIERVALAGP
jgi:Domain of unknown function (DUF4388)